MSQLGYSRTLPPTGVPSQQPCGEIAGDARTGFAVPQVRHATALAAVEKAVAEQARGESPVAGRRAVRAERHGDRARRHDADRDAGHRERGSLVLKVPRVGDDAGGIAHEGDLIDEGLWRQL